MHWKLNLAEYKLTKWVVWKVFFYQSFERFPNCIKQQGRADFIDHFIFSGVWSGCGATCSRPTGWASRRWTWSGARHGLFELPIGCLLQNQQKDLLDDNDGRNQFLQPSNCLKLTVFRSKTWWSRRSSVAATIRCAPSSARGPSTPGLSLYISSSKFLPNILAND